MKTQKCTRMVVQETTTTDVAYVVRISLDTKETSCVIDSIPKNSLTKNLIPVSDMELGTICFAALPWGYGESLSYVAGYGYKDYFSSDSGNMAEVQIKLVRRLRMKSSGELVFISNMWNVSRIGLEVVDDDLAVELYKRDLKEFENYFILMSEMLSL